MAEFIPNRGKFSRVRQKHSLHPVIQKRLQHLAKRDYEDNESAALEGIILYDWIVELNQLKKGREVRHWVSAPLVLRAGELEPLLARLEAGDVDYVGSYLEMRIEERAKELAASKLDEPPTGA